MPKDEQGRHYIVEAGTAKVYPEADTVRLPDSKDSTVIPMTIVHYALSPGDHDENHYDGYGGRIQIEVKMSKIWNATTNAYDDFTTMPAALEPSTYFDYQYFKLPGITAKSRYRRPAPMDSGIFEVYWDGALINPIWQDGFNEHQMSGTGGDIVYPAYYSFDGGQTWTGAMKGGFKLNKQQIADLPSEFSLMVRLPGGIKYSVLNAVGIITPPDPTGPNRPTPENPAIRPDYTRQITVNNSTDAVLIPAQQFYDVPSGNDFVFTIRPAAGKVPKVTTSRNNKTPDNLGVEIKPSTKEPGGYDVRIRKVREELTVTVTYEGNSNVEAAATRVWGENGQLYIMSSATGRANVYNVLGKLNRSVTLSAGETKSVSVPAGIYVVSMNNGKAYKVAVR